MTMLWYELCTRLVVDGVVVAKDVHAANKGGHKGVEGELAARSLLQQGGQGLGRVGGAATWGEGPGMAVAAWAATAQRNLVDEDKCAKIAGVLVCGARNTPQLFLEAEKRMEITGLLWSELTMSMQSKHSPAGAEKKGHHKGVWCPDLCVERVWLEPRRATASQRRDLARERGGG